MKKMTLLWISMLMLILITGCGKVTRSEDGSTSISNATTPAAEPVVYIGGHSGDGTTDQEKPCYWVNEQVVILTNQAGTGSVGDLAVVGKDVYAFGYSHTIWKNASANAVKAPEGAYNIAVSGSDVYLGGTGIWVNGVTENILNNGRVEIGSNDGSNILFVFKDSTTGVMSYRINNGPTYAVISDGSNLSYGICGKPYLNGSDAYFAGSIGTTKDATPYFSNACYWKNGVRVDLPAVLNADSGARGIALSGSDVYVVGWYRVRTAVFRDGRTIPCYWKNGIRTDLTLPTGAIAADTWGIAIHGSDIYIAGGSHDSSGQIACYWKNGEVKTLGAGWAGSIVVK